MNSSSSIAGGATALASLARWASRLRLEDIPKPVRQQAINQILSMLAAVYSGWASELGPRLQRAFESGTYPEQQPGAAENFVSGSQAAIVIPTGERTSAIHAAV